MTAVASGSNPFRPRRLGALKGSATYRGHAAGVYAGTGGTPVFRYFQAEATLTADFDGDLVRGVIRHGTDTATGELLFRQVELKSVRILNPGRFEGPVGGALGSASLDGHWGGRFFSNFELSTAPPGSVAGTFGAYTEVGDRVAISASIAAYRRQLVAGTDLTSYIVSR